MSARDERQGEETKRSLAAQALKRGTRGTRPVLDELDVSMTQTAILQSSTQELDASLDRVGDGIDALVAENARLREVNAALLAALRDVLELDIHGPEAFRRCEAARAALAQAEGREP